jgi:hypothetical protein
MESSANHLLCSYRFLALLHDGSMHEQRFAQSKLANRVSAFGPPACRGLSTYDGNPDTNANEALVRNVCDP